MRSRGRRRSVVLDAIEAVIGALALVGFWLVLLLAYAIGTGHL